MNNPLRMHAEVMAPEDKDDCEKPLSWVAFVASLVIAINGMLYMLYCGTNIWLYIHFNTTRALGLAFVERAVNDNILGCGTGMVVMFFASSFAADILEARRAYEQAQTMQIKKILQQHEQLDHMHPRMRTRFEQTGLERRRAQ